MPRCGALSRAHTANDQTAFVHRLADWGPIEVRKNSPDPAQTLDCTLARSPDHRRYALNSNVPRLVADFLARSGKSWP
jgi:hypothetical protein